MARLGRDAGQGAAAWTAELTPPRSPRVTPGSSASPALQRPGRGPSGSSVPPRPRFPPRGARGPADRASAQALRQQGLTSSPWVPGPVGASPTAGAHLYPWVEKAPDNPLLLLSLTARSPFGPLPTPSSAHVPGRARPGATAGTHLWPHLCCPARRGQGADKSGGKGNWPC